MQKIDLFSGLTLCAARVLNKHTRDLAQLPVTILLKSFSYCINL